MVAVISSSGKPLMPTTNCRARILLKKKRAVIFKHSPVFTIQLTDREDGDTQPIEYASDVGYAHVGISIKSQKHEYVSEQRDLLNDETERHDTRGNRCKMEVIIMNKFIRIFLLLLLFALATHPVRSVEAAKKNHKYSKESYVIDPEKFKGYVNKHGITNIIFTKKIAPKRHKDISVNSDDTVRCWKKGRKMYVSTDRKKKKSIVDETETLIGKLLYGLKKVQSIDVSYLDTSRLKDMSLFFAYNPMLKEIKGIGNLDTYKVKTMRGMFEGDESLTFLDLSGLHVENVEDMAWMFSMNKNLITIVGIETWKTANLENMGGMFACGDSYIGNAKLKNLNVTRLDTHKVKYMNDVFYGCGSIESLDLSNWVTSNVITLDHAFSDMFALRELNVSTWDVSHCVDFNACFNDLRSLEELDVSKWHTLSAIYMCQMFEGNRALKNLDLRSFITLSCKGFSEMFHGCWSLTELDLRSFSTQSVPSEVVNGEGNYWRCDTGLENMFRDCPALEKIYVSEQFFTDGKPMNGAFYKCKARGLTWGL